MQAGYLAQSCCKRRAARCCQWPIILTPFRPIKLAHLGRQKSALAFVLHKRVFDLVKDFGTSESPKSTRSSTTHCCPGRPGHPAFRHNIASSLRLHTGLPYDWTPRSDAPLGSPLGPSARRVSRVASRLPGTTRLRFALHGGQRLRAEVLERDNQLCQPCRRAGRLTVAAEVEHIAPRSLGGAESQENLQSICKGSAGLKRPQRALQRATGPPSGGDISMVKL